MKCSLEGKLAALLFLACVACAAAAVALAQASGSAVLGIAIALTAAIYPILWLSRRILRPIRRLLRALSSSIANYRDGEFSDSLVVDRDDELGDLLVAHNELGRTLREQRFQLTQRELLLETVTQNSPIAFVLVDPHQRIVYANAAVAGLLNDARSLLGMDLAVLLDRLPEPLRRAAGASEDSLVVLEVEGSEETFHVSKRSFLVRAQPHQLYLIKRLTRELSRQEVATWKKLIRLLSHELNNSLGPIASLAQSGLEIKRRGAQIDPGPIFAAIGERAEHLHRFIAGYAAFARLPAPCPDWVDWAAVIDEVAAEQVFRLIGVLPNHPGWFDRAQLVQVLINLVKNAHEAGSPADGIEVAVTQTATESKIDIRDRGTGMTEAVMHQALLPFYSTKRGGTGLGLALAREIADAHGGSIRLSNRVDTRGLCATLILPRPAVGSKKEV